MDISVNASGKKPSHKEWRRRVKKERRRRLRRRAAEERDADAERLRAALEKTAEYSNWIKEQEEEEKQKEIVEEQERIQGEHEWWEKELRAQEEWRALQERREKARQAQLEQEEMIRKEYETKQEAQRRKVEEEKRRIEKELERQEEIQKQINDYIDNGAKTPEFLRTITETQSKNAEICQFFTKTGSCRYGDVCSRNHQKVGLSKVILIPGFYSHYSLENNPADGDNDSFLDVDRAELRQHFEEFYKDVVPELESFGKIKTLKFCRNSEAHLRGNLYVEYYTERDAARAVRKLKGRWFARRQIHCEFTGIKSWRTAICGMARCPKGRFCNFLHVFRNPNNEYDVKSPPRWVKRLDESSRRSESRNKGNNWDDSVRGDMDNNSRNWRWDSPDPEPDRKDGDRRRRYSDDRYQNSKRNNYPSSSRFRNHHNDNKMNRDYDDTSEEEYYSKHYKNSNRRSSRYEDEHRNGNGDSRHRRRKYSSGKSRRSRNDRSRHRKRSHERDRSKEHRSSRKKTKRSHNSDTNEDNTKDTKSNSKEIESKWDYDVANVKEKSNSSSSSSPASSTNSSSSSQEQNEESIIETLETNIVKTPNEHLQPKPVEEKFAIPEYYEWDTTESESDEKK
ncbi:U2 small nuclear ribonucleoprotein auxiliary factor 35 kDa subunit-related protein 2 [Leptopilina heterotoma]|uniref:U2 small nuclear ribonucleoprotein auxiliary factor 35 kDa subunit-related protein 2 n=1 Tax=Leptopilina heterotoma TaxID=63436 RepID=UPI001CA8EB0D|nr:U2 small nuclear ribonucleoprotein auxiliary factor 35 kDa subunit-related protein 2 [Leptopilina heterotoma]